MDQTTNGSYRVESTAFVATDKAARRLCLVGGLSLYDTAIAWLIESRSPHRVVVFTTEEQALVELKTAAVDLVLLDFDLDTASEARMADVSSLLRKLAPRPVLLISTGIVFDTLQSLLRLGVAGVVMKTTPCEMLLEAIDAVGNGKVWLQREVMVETFAETSHAKRFCSESAKISLLTQREREIIAIACTGISNRQIGERLQISEATVRHHLTSVFSKLALSSRGELIVFAYRHRLADGDPAEC